MTLLRRRLAFGEAFINRSIWFWDFFENGTGFRDCLVLLKGGSPQRSLYPSRSRAGAFPGIDNPPVISRELSDSENYFALVTEMFGIGPSRPNVRGGSSPCS